jgi:hypothetical protein
MTYFYKIHSTIARKIGGEPPADEYVAIDPQGVVRHVKNNEIIEETPIEFPNNASQDQITLYKDAMGSQIAKNMLFPKYRKKKNTRKIKVGKRCICK